MHTDIEYWLRGPVAGIISELQPVAHAILQAQSEIEAETKEFPDEWLWIRPGAVASVGFHLRHITGVLDRLFTYARGEQLSAEQVAYLQREAVADVSASVGGLIHDLNTRISAIIEELKHTKRDMLFLERAVGRKRLPSSVFGLMFHAAEHTQRHTGQLLVTARILRAGIS